MRFPRGRCEEIEKGAGEGSDVVAGKSTESNHVHGVVGVGIVDVEKKGGQGVVKEGGSVLMFGYRQGRKERFMDLDGV